MLVGVAFFRRADRARYGDLLRDLRNSYARGRDKYPTTFDASFQMMVNIVDMFGSWPHFWDEREL